MMVAPEGEVVDYMETTVVMYEAVVLKEVVFQQVAGIRVVALAGIIIKHLAVVIKEKIIPNNKNHDVFSSMYVIGFL